MATTTSNATTPTAKTTAGKAYAALIGLASVVVLLQAVWAGLFVREGEDYKQNWVEVHSRGADVAIGLAIIAAIVVAVKLRERRDLLIGTIVFAVLLVAEAYIGGLIGDHPRWTVIHFPIAMGLMGLAVWLPLRSMKAPAAR